MRPITFTDGQIFIFDGGIGRENKFTGKVADLCRVIRVIMLIIVIMVLQVNYYQSAFNSKKKD